MDEEKKGGKVVNMPGFHGVPEAPHFSPAFLEKWQALVELIGDAVDQALADGMPPQFVVGLLSCVQSDVLEGMRFVAEGE